MGFRLANVDERAVLVEGDHYYDVEVLSDGSIPSDPMAALAAHAALHGLSASIADAAPTGSIADVVPGPPVPRPRNSFGVGLNYQSHIAESNMEPPAVPLVFTKFPSCIVAGDSDVVLNSESTDYEAELVVVLGEGGRDIATADAWDRIAGVTIGQDISDRALQFAAKPPHFDLGKSRDTYGPIGPVLVSPDLLTDRDALPITCDVNGERRQDANTSDLLFDVPALVSYISSILTLSAGDLIFTGTPEGVGMATGTFLRPGDEIVTTIGDIGTIRNVCR